MEPKIVKATTINEYFTPERCFIAESWGSNSNANVSIARARVQAGVTTKAHHLENTQEIYIITQGKGKVFVGKLEPTEVNEGDVVIIPAGVTQKIANTGKEDLVFYCICTPSFTKECYHNDEP